MLLTHIPQAILALIVTTLLLWSMPLTASAWSGIWHVPATWITGGAPIDAQKLGESLQYLYNTLTLEGDTLTSISCATNQTAIWSGSAWICGNLPACPAPPPPPPPPPPPTPVYRSGTDTYNHYYY